MTSRVAIVIVSKSNWRTKMLLKRGKNSKLVRDRPKCVLVKTVYSQSGKPGSIIGASDGQPVRHWYPRTSGAVNVKWRWTEEVCATVKCMLGLLKNGAYNYIKTCHSPTTFAGYGTPFTLHVCGTQGGLQTGSPYARASASDKSKVITTMVTRPLDYHFDLQTSGVIPKKNTFV